MRSFFRQPVDDVLAALEPIVVVRSPIRALGPMAVTLIVAWFVYVPIHELLHVFGCVVAGGDVHELQFQTRYGGAILAKVFDFVVTGGDYAGRLSGFDWKGSDLIYLSTDFMPFVLTLLIGVPLVKLAGRRRRPLVFAAGVVVGLAPFYNLPGDYYEMGSILTTRTLAEVGFDTPYHPPEPSEQPDGESEAKTPQPEVDAPILPGDPLIYMLRSDDVFRRITDVFTKPAAMGLEGVGGIAFALVVILVGGIVAVLLAFATYWIGHLLWLPVFGKPAAPAKSG